MGKEITVLMSPLTSLKLPPSPGLTIDNLMGYAYNVVTGKNTLIILDLSGHFIFKKITSYHALYDESLQLLF